MAWMESLQAAGAGQVTACVVSAYILGCFTTGYYLVRSLAGRDIREIQSGNVGALNVGRVLGKPGLLLTALGDVGKGVLAVAATRYFTGNPALEAVALIAVVVVFMASIPALCASSIPTVRAWTWKMVAPCQIY